MNAPVPEAPRSSAAIDDTPHATGSSPDVITVVIVDDHEMIRRGLCQLLERAGGFEILAEASDLAGARRKVLAYRPDVLVLDLNLPDGLALSAIPEIRAAHPETQIVVLTMQEEASYARQALGDGAVGYVLKDAAASELVEAVRRASTGDAYLNPRLGARVAAEPPPGPPDGLSDREAAVLGLIALGHTNPEIADRLGISVRTVETHRSHIQQKLGLSSRSELVRYALRHDLVDRS